MSGYNEIHTVSSWERTDILSSSTYSNCMELSNSILEVIYRVNKGCQKMLEEKTAKNSNRTTDPFFT